jgi:hypothetical protein
VGSYQASGWQRVLKTKTSRTVPKEIGWFSVEMHCGPDEES